MKKFDLIKLPFNKNNPVTVQVLGICSCLAVTAQLKPAVVMALSVTVVVALANLIISLLRNTIPPRIRIIVHHPQPHRAGMRRADHHAGAGHRERLPRRRAP